MITFSGRCVSGGTAAGRILFLGKKRDAEKRNIENTFSEWERCKEALERAKSELSEISRRTMESIGEEEAAIFEIHRMMLDDEGYRDRIRKTITEERVNAEYAVKEAEIWFSEMLGKTGDEYMSARADDVRDVSARVREILSGSAGEAVREGKHVIFAKELMPSDAVKLKREDILGFVTEKGSGNSHAAILARTIGVPAIVGVKGLDVSLDGKMCALDAEEGKIYVEPDSAAEKKIRQKAASEKNEKKLLEEQRGKLTETRSGRKIALFANAASLEDIKKAQENDAEGIGLFRSEFLYLEREDYPDEEEQFKAYREAVEAMRGKKLIIRTLDIGADKTAGYFNLPEEENPAMGLRGIRICLKRREMFKTQLCAILRASVFGNIAVMFPLVASCRELSEIKAVLAEAKENLVQRSLAFDDRTELGVMIETPAAALISDLLAREVDFFSIGTNDLTQYTLAVDRQNEMLDEFYDPHHEAVMRLIEMSVKNAHREGKWVGICGEAGADASLTEWFLKIGVDEISVSPSKILKIRAKIREMP